MSINNLGELEQIIDKLPDRTFSFTYPSGLQVTLWHDNLWHGEITGINRPDKADAATFQEIHNVLIRTHLDDHSQQQLLDAARKRLASEA